MLSYMPLFHRFLLVIEMEIKILGSRHFLITMTQSGSKSPKLRYFVVKTFLSLLYKTFSFSILKILVIGVLTPSTFIFCHAFFCF